MDSTDEDEIRESSERAIERARKHLTAIREIEAVEEEILEAIQKDSLKEKGDAG